MAQVIDRLQVRGISAAGDSNCENKLQNKFGMGKCGGGELSPASRRLEHTQRIKAAYNGITSMDTVNSTPGVQFVLHGKNLKRAETDPEIIFHGVNAGDKTIPRKSKSEPLSNFERNGKKSREDDNNKFPSFPTTYIMLAPPATPLYLNNYMSSKTAKESFLRESFEIMGQRVNGLGTAERTNGESLLDHHNALTPRLSRKWTSRNFANDGPQSYQGTSSFGRLQDISISSSPSNAQSLKQCLHVQQSRRLQNHLEQEALKLKHFTQFVRKDGKMANNPYRCSKAREMKPLLRVNLPNKYDFKSVNSYIHFNKIYPPTSGDGKPNPVPQLNGFPAHCTDTVMLKMMMEMNRQKSMKPKNVDRYSDIGVHQDLEEFLMVRSSSTVSKPNSTKSKKNGRGRSSKSLVSNTEDVVEEAGICEWAGNNISEDVHTKDTQTSMDT